MFLSGPYNIGHDHEVFEVVGRQIVHMKYSANNCLQYIYFIVLGFLILRDFEISLDRIFPIFTLLLWVARKREFLGFFNFLFIGKK